MTGSDVLDVIVGVDGATSPTLGGSAGSGVALGSVTSEALVAALFHATWFTTPAGTDTLMPTVNPCEEEYVALDAYRSALTKLSGDGGVLDQSFTQDGSVGYTSGRHGLVDSEYCTVTPGGTVVASKMGANWLPRATADCPALTPVSPT